MFGREKAFEPIDFTRSNKNKTNICYKIYIISDNFQQLTQNNKYHKILFLRYKYTSHSIIASYDLIKRMRRFTRSPLCSLKIAAVCEQVSGS
jgi:hypothetical protein